MVNSIIASDAMMFLSAYEFLKEKTCNAAKNAVDSRNRKIQPGLELVVPMIINGALACELYFKSLITNQGDYIGKHRLDELEVLLDSDIQKLIMQIVIKIRCEKNESYDDKAYHQDLLENGKAFVDWRYFYEKTSLHINTEFVNDLLYALKAVVKIISEKIDIKAIDYSNIRIE